MKNNTLGNTLDNGSEELRQLLARLPAGSVWHDVVDSHGNSLCHGAGHPNDGIGPVLHLLNFKDKGVLDLGCNTGHNASLAIQAGAKHVIGIDSDALLIEAAKLLAKTTGNHAAHFIEGCYSDIALVSQFAESKEIEINMVLLVDFIGKKLLRKGRLNGLIDTLKRYDCREMVLTVRPLYRIRKHFDMSEKAFAALYPTNCIRGNQYHAALDIANKMEPEWQLVSPLSPDQYTEGTSKTLLHFLKR